VFASIFNYQLTNLPNYQIVGLGQAASTTPRRPETTVATVFTIGHSTRDLADFSRVLQTHDIEILEDIRAFPMSRRYPHFNRESLELWLPEIGCDYVWGRDLGGRRGGQMPVDESPNVALRNPSFRNYADYMLTAQFQRAIERLLERAQAKRTAIMCAEYVYFRCHRMLVSDYLVAHRHQVLHILDEKPPTAHKLSNDARIVEGKVIYRGDYLL
jgi:uncharacterized protein (DUF488 family)